VTGVQTCALPISAEAYGAGWNGSNEVPTKNDVYDQIESIPEVASGAGITVNTVGLTTTIATDTATIPTLTSTSTLTNKRITPRVGSTTSSATPTINTDDYDAYSITALAVAITSFTTNLTGTPTNFQKLLIRIKDDGTARAITWGSSFEAKGEALPTTTVISKVLTVGFIYDTVTSKWGCVASVSES
jgi:hypothetical protein